MVEIQVSCVWDRRHLTEMFKGGEGVLRILTECAKLMREIDLVDITGGDPFMGLAHTLDEVLLGHAAGEIQRWCRC